ncbi:MAG: HRDC domain-containing protein [Dysgonamonadaceae bacterium]|jgi:hypothetical protein|nr:HRDC domain-containing protein [Dysgonamonadaceae bacterium]
MPYSDPYECAQEFSDFTNRNIFITGKAGTGKTTFLHRLRAQSKKQMAVVAPTGVAAINAGGVTIHSFFQLPFTPFIPTPLGREGLLSKMKMNSARRRVIRELELLVIDEISMVRADVLDAIDAVLRGIRHKSALPFGGVQMIFIGDMYQLSPVAQTEEWRILSEYYAGIYFFHSRVFQEQPPVYIEFDKIFRQSDNRFIEMLNEVRNDALSPSGMELLQSRYNPSFAPAEKDSYITLTTHNYKADAINSDELAKIKSPLYRFKATVKGDFPEKSYPVEASLELKIGAKVMFVKNDTESPRRFFNGKIGEITKIEEDEFIAVKCPEDDDEIIVTRMAWENIRYSTNEATTAVEEEVIGTFTQFPLRLAWAITIHKSQGLTFDRAIIDAGAAFSPGQVYVALSRCRSLEGLVLQSPINRYSVQVDEQVLHFSSQAPEMDAIIDQLQSSKEAYQSGLLLDLFGFGTLVNSAGAWYGETKTNESSFSEDALSYIQNVINQIVEIEAVAAKFRLQLEQILRQSPVDAAFLNERLKASSGYFSEKLEMLMETLRESAVTTDNRSNAQEYDDNISSLFTAAAQKRHIIGAVADGFDIEIYFAARNRFVLPPFPVSAYSRNSTKQQLKSVHSDLLHELIRMRSYLSDTENLPIYIIASTKTLVQMADSLPRTEKELLKIHGFGKVKVQRFGAQFLKIIADYAAENGLESRPIDFQSDEKPKKEKKPKGSSALESLRMFREGLSIAEIAKERRLVETTIAGHLSGFVASGQIPVDKLVEPEKISLAEKRLTEKSEGEPLYTVLGDLLSPAEITIFLAWKRGES